MAEYQELLPAMPPDQWRRIRGEQEIIVRYEPERGARDAARAARATRPIATRLVTLVRRLLADERVQRAKPSTEQLAMIEHIGETLAVAARRQSARARRPERKSKRKSAGKRGAKRRDMTPWNARTRSTRSCSISASRCRRRRPRSRIRATRARCAARSKPRSSA